MRSTPYTQQLHVRLIYRRPVPHPLAARVVLFFAALGGPSVGWQTRSDRRLKRGELK